MAEDISIWAAREGLTDQIADIVEQQGFTTVDDLKNLSSEDITDVFLKTKLLKGKDFIALRNAVSSLSLDVDHPQSESYGAEHQQSYGAEHQQSYETEHQQSYGAEHQQPYGAEHQQPYVTEHEHTAEYCEAIDHLRPGHVKSMRERFSQPHGRRAAKRQAAAAPETRPGFFSRLFKSSDNVIEEEFRLLMLGKTGSGKSTTGNTILGEEKFTTSIRFSSVTADSDLQRTEKKGRLIEVMDCPGLYDTSKSQTEIAQVVVQAVACMHPGPHAILYVCRLGRFTAEEFGVFQRLKALFDDHITDYMIVLFTGGDDLEREKKQLADLLEDAPKDLIQVIRECGHRCLVFNNTAKDKKSQVDKLLDEVRKIKSKNEDQPHYQCPKYETVGTFLEEEVQRRLAEVTKRDIEREQYVLELETKTKEAVRAFENLKAEIVRKERERGLTLEKENEKNRKEEQQFQQELQAKQESEENRIEREREFQHRLQLQIDELVKQQVEERRKEKEMLSEKEREKLRLENQRLEEEREERIRRDEAYREEMHRAKEDIAKNENPGFFALATSGIMSAVSTVKSWLW